MVTVPSPIRSEWKRKAWYMLAGVLLSGFVLGSEYFARKSGLIALRWNGAEQAFTLSSRSAWIETCFTIMARIPLVSVAVVLVLRFIRGRRIKVVSYCVGAALPYGAAVTFVLWQFFGHEASNYMHRQGFDSKVWKSYTASDGHQLWAPRVNMAHDLVSRRLLDNLSKSEVIELLGAPSEDPTCIGEPCRRLSYKLGSDRGVYGTRQVFLSVTLDSQNKVTEYHMLHGSDGF